MAPSDDLIDFDIIEGQKENIQSLPGGRSAKKLAELYSPSPLHKLSTPTPTDTKNINDCVRAEFEEELTSISESDDPLDVYDRYVRWTFDAYPSAQATPQSQLHTLLERATKAFIGSAQYKDDPRYLKLWLHYIRFFSDAPRETFVFLARHSIGESLALFYEEYAEWLEGAGRWNQAEEVYKLGIEREARPQQRLVRKFGEFEQRRDQHPEADNAPSSPALPTLRPALAAKIDPYAAAARAADPQAPRSNMGVGGPSSKPGRSKMAIFSDADAEQPAMPPKGGSAKGWDTIGSLADRRKENTMEAKPWVGETLKAGGKKSSTKMAVFRDPSLARIAESHIVIAPSQHQVIVNPRTGRKERVFVNLEAVYPTPEEPGTELSFEEIWAASRGWLDASWDDVEECDDQQIGTEVDLLSEKVATKLQVHQDVAMVDENGHMVEQPKSKGRKKKVMEVNETQIIKAKLDSPSKPKLKKKNTSEPTMTIHTKAATDEIYELFNAPLQPSHEQDESDDDEVMTDGDYTSGGESTCTTRQIQTSDAGDEQAEIADDKSLSEWSEFSARKDIPNMNDEDEAEEREEENGEEGSDLIDAGEPIEVHTLHDNAVEELPPGTRTMYVPLPPEDYVPQLQPYRDPAEVANNRLPFMTPITERTESSLGVITAGRPHYDPDAESPSKQDSIEEEEDDEEDEEFEPPSSPLRDVNDDFSPIKISVLQEKVISKPMSPLKVSPFKKAAALPKGPIVKDEQCSPLDAAIRDEILSKMHPPLSSYPGFFDHRTTRCDRGPDIRKFIKALSKTSRNSTGRRSSVETPVVLDFPEVNHSYTLRRGLGEGAFAPVYLVESSAPDVSDDTSDNEPLVQMGKGAFAVAHRASLEALKMEQPPTAWEFYMMRLAATRLGPQHRARASISTAHEMHLYQDEGFFFLSYHPYGTLLDVVNIFRSESSGVMDESLAMFFTVELLRTVEALHAKQLIHGDLKADNCLLRLDDDAQSLNGQWRADGSGGWASRGITLIDFGRAIDLRAFSPNAQFICDWKTSPQDCAEMREGRPWTWQIDYHGLAGIIHCLLFGKYIETVRCDQGGLGTTAGRRYKIRESLKRYWQTDIWNACFDLLLNPGSYVEEEEGRQMPVMKGMRRVRESMEGWLERNCEKGVGLKGLMGRVEAWAKGNRK